MGHFVVVSQSVITENAHSPQMNVAIQSTYSFFIEYFKDHMKNSDTFPHYHSKIMQFDWFLSVPEHKRLENHDIYGTRNAE